MLLFELDIILHEYSLFVTQPYDYGYTAPKKP